MRLLQEAVSERLAPAQEEIRRRREEQERRMQDKLNEVARTSDTLLKGMRAELVALKTTSLSVEEGHKYVNHAVDKMKSDIHEKYGHDLNELRSQCKKAYREMNAEIRSFKADQYKELADTTWTSSAPQLATKIREQLIPEISSKVQQHVKETIDASTPETQAKLKEMVQTQVRSHLEDPKAYDNLIKESNEFKALHTRVQTVDKLLKDMEPVLKGLERMEGKVKDFESKLDQLTQVADALMKQRGGSIEDSELVKSLARRMDEMRTELNGTVDQLKTSENLVNMRYREIEQYLSPSDEPARKRQRISESESAATATAAVEEGESSLTSSIDDLMNKFELLERKHTHMLDYIEQFRTTTLHPQFPTRLQEVVANLFSNQQNHEGILAHLVDPIAASSGQRVNLAVTPEGAPLSSDTPIMSPAMMQAIQELVQKKVDEQVSKHVSRLNELEKQYQQRQGGSGTSSTSTQ